jgi:phage-related protein
MDNRSEIKWKVELTSYVQEFLDNLDENARGNIIWAMDLLTQFGITLGAPYVKYMGDKLYELRVKAHTGNYRTFYFCFKQNTFVFVHAITKKTQKTPPRDLETARKRMAAYIQYHSEWEATMTAKNHDHETAKLKSISLDEYKRRRFTQHPGDKVEYEKLRPYYEAVSEFITLRNKKGVSQEKLSSLSHIPRPSISRMESGKVTNVSIAFLQKLVAPLGYRPKISFVKS